MIARSKTDKIIAGVCGGIAEYDGINSMFIRMIFISLAFFHGIGILLYIILVLIMPSQDQVGNISTHLHERFGICPKCGHKNEINAKFCNDCGFELPSGDKV